MSPRSRSVYASLFLIVSIFASRSAPASLRVVSMPHGIHANRAPASAEGTPKTLTFGAEKAELLDFSESHLVISRSCQKLDGTLSCEAYSAFQRAQGFKVNGTDPSVQALSICKMTGGKRSVGRDEHGNEDGYCRFDDGSLLDLGSLFGAVGR